VFVLFVERESRGGLLILPKLSVTIPESRNATFAMVRVVQLLFQYEGVHEQQRRLD
jgi:hypothetical protein